MIIQCEEFNEKYGYVSRETYSKIETYLESLSKWNKKINLFSRALNQEILFEKLLSDSLGLANHIKDKNLKIIDVGSGNGFPGIILAILGFNINLVEIKTKKAVFLQQVITLLRLNSKVYHQDIKSLDIGEFDIITAKAFSSLKNIIEWTQDLYGENTKYLLLKSFTNEKEILELNQSNISLELQEHQNAYNSDSAIIELKNIKVNEKS